MLNWLALAGWGSHHKSTASSSSDSGIDHSSCSHDSHNHYHEAPESTAVYTLPELIREFDLSAVTHRNSSLDPTKLEYLNKQHLLRERSTPEGLDGLTKRAMGIVQGAFPESPYATEEMTKNATLLLEGRLTNLKELPLHAYFLYEEPDLEGEEAKQMEGMFDSQVQGTSLPPSIPLNMF